MEITFITHLRYDSDDRIKNFQVVLDYYSSMFSNAKFIIVEDDVRHNILIDSIKWPEKRTSYYLMENAGHYHRTRAFNEGIKMAKTDVVAILDTDCIATMPAIVECYEKLKTAEYTMAWPYNGFVINVFPHIRDIFIHEKHEYNTLIKILNNNLTPLVNFSNKDYTVWSNRSVGGLVMFNRKKLIEAGGYNENFISWGYEDNEIEIRISKLGNKLYRHTDINSILFHFYHKNTIRSEHPYYASNHNEVTKITNMQLDQLIQYSKTGNFIHI
jgi:predicted glycosyltransferase involved in capsule biosynthesis